LCNCLFLLWIRSYEQVLGLCFRFLFQRNFLLFIFFLQFYSLSLPFIQKFLQAHFFGLLSLKLALFALQLCCFLVCAYFKIFLIFIFLFLNHLCQILNSIVKCELSFLLGWSYLRFMLFLLKVQKLILTYKF